MRRSGIDRNVHKVFFPSGVPYMCPTKQKEARSFT